MIKRIFEIFKRQTPKKLLVMLINIFRIGIIKLMHPGKFKASPIQNISPTTEIALEGGNLILHHSIYTRRYVSFRSSYGGILEIGTSFFNQGCIVTCMKHVKIGDDCLFGPNVVIVDDDHDFRYKGNMRGNHYKCSDVIIGDNVWVGANTVILRGTTIGDNCVIGAGSTIKGNFGNNLVLVEKNGEIVQKPIQYYEDED